MAKKRKLPLLHDIVFAGSAEIDEMASTYYLDGVAYCWTQERGLIPRPRGWGTRGKVYVGFSPDDLLGIKRPAAPGASAE